VGNRGACSRSRERRRFLLALLGSDEFEPWTVGFERELLEAPTGDGSMVIVATA
jgi:hypothetical protein